MNRVPSKGPSRRTRVAEEPASSSRLRPCSDRGNPSPEREHVTPSVTLEREDTDHGDIGGTGTG